MGGKAHADNDTIVKEQKKQAEDAARKETERQTRIMSGLRDIGYAFEGRPVMKSVTDQVSLGGGGVPTGYTPVYVDASGRVLQDRAATKGGFKVSPQSYLETGGTGQTATYSPGSAAVSAANLPGARLAYRGPDGQIHMPGESISSTHDVATGEYAGGFDEGFYDAYNKSIQDYYDPQIAKQFQKAKDQATYALARAGTVRSSAANDINLDLIDQNAQNLEAVANKADIAEGQFKDRVASARTQATNQLYATENPDVAVNQALAAVNNISLQSPDLSPLADLFNVAAIGGANIMANANNAGFIGKFRGGLPPKTGSGHIEETA
jgi:hypothetical protein